MPGVALMRGGRSFCSQLMVVSPSRNGPALVSQWSRRDQSGRLPGDLVHGRSYGGEPRCGALGRLRWRTALDFLDDSAADDERVGVRGDGLWARGVANAEADANGKCDMLSDLGQPGDGAGDVDVACARDAL